jgi:ubiquitin-conjugating enzyme E2 G2
MSCKALHKQLEKYFEDPLEDLILEPNETDGLKVHFTLVGPNSTPWSGVIMNGLVKIPQDYPYSPPSIVFDQNVFHPNIYTDGKVCLSILLNKSDETGYFQESELWKPTLDLKIVFLCIINLFIEPNLESPANLDACVMYRNDKKELTKLIRSSLSA